MRIMSLILRRPKKKDFWELVSFRGRQKTAKYRRLRNHRFVCYFERGRLVQYELLVYNQVFRRNIHMNDKKVCWWN